MSRVKLPSVHQAQVNSPPQADLDELIRVADERYPVLACAIRVAATTGIRRGELCALRWSDIDLERGLLTVGRSVTVINGRWSEGPTKTHQVRRLALDGFATGVLRERIRHQKWYADEAHAALVADPFLLSRRADGSEPCLPHGLTVGFARLCKVCGMVKSDTDSPMYHWHELRHFSISTAIAAGHDIVGISRRAGHSDVSVTLNVYAHAEDARDREIAGTLGAGFRAILPPTSDNRE